MTTLAARLKRYGFSLPSWSRSPPDVACRPATATRTIRFYLVKPSRYDDDGGVMQFRWGVIPNNTLSVVAGLLAAYAEDHPGVCIETILWDELVDGALASATIATIVRQARDHGVELIVGLAGVQTNQYPRGRDIALQFRAHDTTVLFGGFHVSSHPGSVDFLCAHGVTVVLGEAEPSLAALLDDYLRGALQPKYRVSDGIRARTGDGHILVPSIERAPLPAIDARYSGRFFNPTFATIDTSRGCPFTCSYCSVKNVMGRTMRSRDPLRIAEWVRAAHDEHGIRNLLVVDDDLFRSPQWSTLFASLAELRRSGREVALVIQTDIESATHGRDGRAAATADERSRRFVDLAAAAGCFEVFMGLESFEPGNLHDTAKFHNQEHEDRRGHADVERARARVKERYRRAVDNWHAAGVGVHAGFMIGLPHDHRGCGARAARDLTEIGIDIAAFFAYTPLPGTEDYDRLAAAGAICSDDFNQYDSTHFVARHAQLSLAELACEYDDAYRTFYSWRRLAWSLGTRHAMPGLSCGARYGMLAQQIYFTYATRRGWHPMMGGIWRTRGGPRRTAISDDEAAAAWLPQRRAD